MFDRITNIQEVKGKFNKGLVEAELDIKDKMWFFDCHFKEDPVMPGCLGLDAMWSYNVIKEVGNYKEIYERNVGENTPIGLKRGLNKLYIHGGLLYAPPLK